MGRHRVVRAGALLALAAYSAWAVSPFFGRPAAAQEKQAKAPDKAAVERAREQVKMLDDLYKTAVVGINDTYVEKQADIPAAVVAAHVFDVMKKKGYHSARLVDASGKPKSKVNLPDTEFEKKAIKEIRGGKTYYEEVGQADGKPVFRAATVVPAVNNICAKCHGVKQGDLLGAIVYEIPIK
jgi:hypothetical protein